MSQFNLHQSPAINPEFLTYCQSRGLDVKQCVLFAVIFKMDSKYGGSVDGLLHFADEMGMIDSRMIIALLDHEGEEPTLRVPLYDEEKLSEVARYNALFKTLVVERLIGDGLMNSRGHRNNPQDYNVLSVTQKDIDVFTEAVKLIEQDGKSFDLEKAQEVITKYYETAKPALKLENYLAKTFVLDYESE
jgi:hypothetical protein